MADYDEKHSPDTTYKGVDTDSEAHAYAVPQEPGLHRAMKNRHIAMISIGGVIGTGLFLGTAGSLSNGGPVGLLLGYLIIGSLCYCTMVSLGEMAALLPIPGGHITYAARFVSSSWSFALGWQYWYNWVIILPAELSAAAVLINYWNKSVNNAVWITMCIVVVILINMFGPAVYGEAEFIFASIKVLTITGLIILGIVLDLGGGPNHDRLGFRYWKHPGPFNQYAGIEGAKGRFLAFWAVLTQAAFSYIGTEVVAIAGAESKNPRRNIPKAIKRVYVRILLFYIGGVTIIGLLVPYNNPHLNLASGTAAASPFVIAIQTAGIKGLPSVINACILTSAWSAANSDMYCSSRALYGLALAGNAPKIFTKVNRFGLPYYCVIVSALIACLSYMDVSSGSGRVFGWFANMTSVAGLMSWFAIAVTYIRFHKGLKAQGIDRNTLPYRSPLQPFAAWYAAILAFVVCFFSGWSVFLKGNWSAATFVTNYLPFMLYPVMVIGSGIWKREWLIKPQDMDFKSGLDEVLAASYDEPPPRNWVERIWAAIM
ncbi:amino acid permease [Sparassis latifolia]|uniref:Dicarboxylic amino acid permease n=1 Tax=Sparassis crispa TaxID=139825 RepID=A0A401GEC4_9APHY|nr:Dicarboxylic amino acid permease [Sparassis crispa]GBE80532.1 Dicarboxylic amino acid permease [Sparassis crispa]